MGVSERLQQLRANFHEHPVRDWLLVAIGAAALVVAVLTLLRTGSGTSTATPVTPTDPGSPVGGGGGSGGTGGNGGPVIPPPVLLGPGPSQPVTHPGAPVGITPGQWINTAPHATDSQSDPTYGKPPAWQNTAPHATDSQSDSSYGSTPINNPTSASQLAHRGRAEPGDVSSAQLTAPTLNQVQTAPAHIQAGSEQQPVVRSGAIIKPAKGRR